MKVIILIGLDVHNDSIAVSLVKGPLLTFDIGSGRVGCRVVRVMGDAGWPRAFRLRILFGCRKFRLIGGRAGWVCACSYENP
jgi:hypothetical protein